MISGSSIYLGDGIYEGRFPIYFGEKSQRVITVYANDENTGIEDVITRTVTESPYSTIAEGTYTQNQWIELYTNTTGATIYYSLDETTPTINSTVYETPILISNSLTLQAIAVKEGMTNSDIVTWKYKIEPYIDLLDLEIIPGDIIPIFDPNTFEYQALVSSGIDSIEILASAITGASIYGVGEKELEIGENLFHIRVEKEGKTTREYRLEVFRSSAIVSAEDIRSYAELGSSLEEAREALGEMVEATLTGGEQVYLPVVWKENTSPAYAGTKIRSYVFEGEFVNLPEELDNDQKIVPIGVVDIVLEGLEILEGNVAHVENFKALQYAIGDSENKTIRLKKDILGEELIKIERMVDIDFHHYKLVADIHIETEESGKIHFTGINDEESSLSEGIHFHIIGNLVIDVNQVDFQNDLHITGGGITIDHFGENHWIQNGHVNKIEITHGEGATFDFVSGGGKITVHPEKEVQKPIIFKGDLSQFPITVKKNSKLEIHADANGLNIQVDEFAQGSEIENLSNEIVPLILNGDVTLAGEFYIKQMLEEDVIITQRPRRPVFLPLNE